MGLAVAVGALAASLEEPDAYADEIDAYRQELAAVNRVLAANGRPPHHEPETLPALRDRSKLAGLPYRWLHLLRRAVAFARHAPDRFKPAPARWDPETDPLLDDELSLHMDSHLICHSDSEGYYVPQDFPEPLYDDLEDDHADALPGGILGSSQQALRELVLAAPLLGIKLRAGKLSDAGAKALADEPTDAHAHGIERKVWLHLYEGFRHSVEHGAAVMFG